MNADTMPASLGFLDRPILGRSKITWWHVAIGVVTLFILFTRLWDLTARAYCHDEAIHAWESWKLFSGQGYIHNPVYHSPFLYHFTALLYWLFGDNEFTGRLGAAIGGIGIAVLPLMLNKWLGKRGVLMAIILLAISPVLMARTRFIRHDQWAVFFNLLLLIGILRYLANRKPRDLYLVAVSLSLSFAGKETSYISVFIFGACIFGLFLWEWLPDRKRPWRDLASFDLLIVVFALVLPLASPFGIQVLGRDPVDYSTTQAIVFSGVILGIFMVASIVIGLLWNRRRFLVCAGLFWGIYTILYTTFFTNGQGFASGAVGSLGYWLSQHGVKRGSQPWYYYLIIVWMYEFLPFLGAIFATVLYALRGNSRKRLAAVVETSLNQAAPPSSDAIERKHDGNLVPAIPMLIAWTFGTLALYSWAGEKMPWLAMQWSVPMAILAGWGISHLWEGVWQALRSRNGWWLLISIPVLCYSLYHLVTKLPTGSTSTTDLSRAMGWVAALLVGGAAGYVSVRVLLHLKRHQARNTVAMFVVSILAVLTLRFAIMVSFLIADLPTAFIVYAQGSPDTRLVTRELEDMSRRLYGDLSMKVAYDDDSFWPMVWYLRNFSNTEIIIKSPSGPTDAAVVIVGPSNEDATIPFLGDRYYRRQYRLIWWPDESWYRDMTPQRLWGQISTAQGRQYLAKIWWNHEWENLELTRWSLVNNFAMYVRKDVAPQLWDFGPETASTADQGKPDEYLTMWSSRTAAEAWDKLGLASPRGLALDLQGNVYIADSGNNRIVVADADGNLLRAFGQFGSEPGQLNEPWAVAVAANGDVYIADTWNYRIQVFSADGVFKFGWGGSGQMGAIDGSGNVLYGPRSLAFDSEGNVLVVDTGNKRIVKYAPDGTFIAGFGGDGGEPGKMREPVGLVVAKDGTVLVADTWNQRIQTFDSALQPLAQWPVRAWVGTSVGNKPYLALDAQGNVYTTDPSGNRIIKFDPDGLLLAIWGQAGSDFKSLSTPTGILVDSRNRLLVADSSNNRIVVFDLEPAQ
ncbi:MAG: flippase activity-associated protein Agl23 [Anaerolineae bacterium]